MDSFPRVGRGDDRQIWSLTTNNTMAHRDGEGNADEKHERRARLYAIQPRTWVTAGFGSPGAAASATAAAGVREALALYRDGRGQREHNKREIETQLHSSSSSSNNNNKHQEHRQSFKGNLCLNLLREQPELSRAPRDRSS